MRKVDAGTIDACVYSQTTGDTALKSAAVKNVKRQLFDNFNQYFALQKGAKNGPVDKMITDGLAKLKASGRVQEIMGDLIKISQYSDWQP
jgi:ABC-type amino acid transport substrate-binding protein